LDKSKGHKSVVPMAKRLVFELGRDIMTTNIFTKSGEDQMITVQVTEWTSLKHLIFDNSRAIIPTCPKQYGWLSNLIEILWSLTF